VPGIIVGWIACVVIQNEHLGCFGHAGIERVCVQLAEARREVAMLQRRDVLVLEKDHLVLEKRRTDLRDLVIDEISRKIDAFHDRADGRGERARSDLWHLVLDAGNV
jgi:hypothetical protein